MWTFELLYLINFFFYIKIVSILISKKLISSIRGSKFLSNLFYIPLAVHIVIIVLRLDSLANTKIMWINIEMKIIEASFDESNVYSLFVYAVRS
jgi:hypothetical protein